ncbi:hypothetical protein D3C72_2046810 [compost metagenome]
MLGRDHGILFARHRQRDVFLKLMGDEAVLVATVRLHRERTRLEKIDDSEGFGRIHVHNILFRPIVRCSAVEGRRPACGDKSDFITRCI